MTNTLRTLLKDSPASSTAAQPAGARAAASWALGDDGPLYCLARRGGIWRKRGGAERWSRGQLRQRCSRDAPGKRFERMARACLAR